MVRCALIALLCAIAAPALAQSRVEVRAPECAMEALDVELLRELLAIELSETDAIEVDLDASLCDAASASVEARIALPPSGREGTERFEIPADLDARERARALALAIAERARWVVAATVEPVPEREPALGLADALASPIGEAPEEPPSGVARELGPTIGVAVRGRIAPVLPSWAIGLRADAGAHLDASWSLRGELIGTWSRASPTEGDADAFVVAGAGAVGLTLYRDHAIELVAAARVEAGVLVAMGTLMGGALGRATAHPWGTAGGELGLEWWLVPGVAVVADVGVSAIVFGTQIVTAPSGTQIDLSIVTIDLDAGVRFAL